MSDSPYSVDTTVWVTVVCNSGPQFRKVVKISWNIEDPLAVQLSFDSYVEPSQWSLAREFLNEVLTNRLEKPEDGGSGFIQGWVEERPFMTYVVLQLRVASERNSSTRYKVEIPAAELSGFLKRTYELLPEGEEGAILETKAPDFNMDDELAALCGG